MKLKKIASLALAGVMAVSMLAGCAGKTGTTENEGTTVTTGAASAVVDAFNNDVKYDDEDMKVTFTYSSALESELKSVLDDCVEGYGFGAGEMANILQVMKLRNGVKVYTGTTDFNAQNKQTVTVQNAAAYSSVNALNQEKLVEAAVAGLENVVKTLKSSNLQDGAAEGTKYLNYTYTGEVAVVTVKSVTGVTYTYVAYTVSQAAAEATYEL